MPRQPSVAWPVWCCGLSGRYPYFLCEISRHGLAVARGRLESQLSELVFPPKTNAANERLAQHLRARRDDLFTFLRQPGLDATNWRAELAIRFGVILRKVWGGSRTWAGARAQAVLMSVWRTCWQQKRSALDFLSQLVRGMAVALAPDPRCGAVLISGQCYTDRRQSGYQPVRRKRGPRCNRRNTCCWSSTC